MKNKLINKFIRYQRIVVNEFIIQIMKAITTNLCHLIFFIMNLLG